MESRSKMVHDIARSIVEMAEQTAALNKSFGLQVLTHVNDEDEDVDNVDYIELTCHLRIAFMEDGTVQVRCDEMGAFRVVRRALHNTVNLLLESHYNRLRDRLKRTEMVKLEAMESHITLYRQPFAAEGRGPWGERLLYVYVDDITDVVVLKSTVASVLELAGDMV